MDQHDLLRLRSLLEAVRRELFPRPRRRTMRFHAAELREGVAEKLVEALNVVEGLAKMSERKLRKGTGGIPAKARWYQLMTYIAQILDGVLRNLELGEVEAKLETLEKAVDELQRQTPQTAG